MDLTANHSKPYPGTILVVDDEPAFVTLASGVLQRAGYETLPATRVTDSITCLKDNFVDLILMDERLDPDRESGTRLLGELRKDHPGLTGIVISANADLDLAQRAMRAGAVDILAKPVDEGTLLEAVRRALDGNELVREARRNRWVAQRISRPPEIVGSSKAIRDVMEMVGLVAHTPIRPCSCRESRGRGRNWWRRQSTWRVHAVTGIWSRPTWRRFRPK